MIFMVAGTKEETILSTSFLIMVLSGPNSRPKFSILAETFLMSSSSNASSLAIFLSDSSNSIKKSSGTSFPFLLRDQKSLLPKVSIISVLNWLPLKSPKMYVFISLLNSSIRVFKFSKESISLTDDKSSNRFRRLANWSLDRANAVVSSLSELDFIFLN